MPGTGSVCIVFVYLTILGLGPSIFVDSLIYNVNFEKRSQIKTQTCKKQRFSKYLLFIITNLHCFRMSMLDEQIVLVGLFTVTVISHGLILSLIVIKIRQPNYFVNLQPFILLKTLIHQLYHLFKPNQVLHDLFHGTIKLMALVFLIKFLNFNEASLTLNQLYLLLINFYLIIHSYFMQSKHFAIFNCLPKQAYHYFLSLILELLSGLMKWELQLIANLELLKQLIYLIVLTSYLDIFPFLKIYEDMIFAFQMEQLITFFLFLIQKLSLFVTFEVMFFISDLLSFEFSSVLASFNLLICLAYLILTKIFLTCFKIHLNLPFFRLAFWHFYFLLCQV